MTVRNRLITLLIISARFCVTGLRAKSAKMSPQKLQDPVLLSPKTINCLRSVDAMRTAGVEEMTVPGNSPDKRFWLQSFGSDMRIAWNVFSDHTGEYRPTFVVNSSEETKIMVTGLK